MAPKTLNPGETKYPSPSGSTTPDYDRELRERPHPKDIEGDGPSEQGPARTGDEKPARDEPESAAKESDTPLSGVKSTSRESKEARNPNPTALPPRSLQGTSSTLFNPASANFSGSYSNPTQGPSPPALPSQDQAADHHNVEKPRWRGAPRVDDLTAFHPGQTNWSIRNLPDILYILRPTAAHTKSRARVHKTKHPIFGKYVNDFPMLPRQISSRVEGWRVEAWCRMDRRITPQDIIDRVNPAFKVTEDEIQMRRYRFRQAFNVAAWGSGSSIAAIARVLERAGIDPSRNTTRGLTPGLIDPSAGEAGGRVPLPPNWNDIDSTGLQSFQQTSPRLQSSHRVSYGLAPVPSSIEFGIREPGPRERYVVDTDVIESKLTLISSRGYKYSSFEDAWRENFPEYPDRESSLAQAGRIPARTFAGEAEGTATTELEAYLKKSGLSFEEWLENDENKDESSDT